MHPLFFAADRITEEVIGAAVEVHRRLGPGLMESIYEWCLIRELTLRGFACTQQKTLHIHYKGVVRNEPLKCDLVIDNCLLVEIKALQGILPIHKAQLMSYMKLLDIPLGLLINFHEMILSDGIARMLLPGANRPQSSPLPPLTPVKTGPTDRAKTKAARTDSQELTELTERRKNRT